MLFEDPILKKEKLPAVVDKLVKIVDPVPKIIDRKESLPKVTTRLPSLYAPPKKKRTTRVKKRK